MPAECFRMVTRTGGYIATVAATLTSSDSGDCKVATSAKSDDPCGIPVDVSDDIYIADALTYLIQYQWLQLWIGLDPWCS